MSGAGGSEPSDVIDRLRDGSRDLSVGSAGERAEPLDHRVRDLAALAYLIVTCDRLGIEIGEEWDSFMYARAIHRRICAATTYVQSAEPGTPSPQDAPR